MKCPKCGYLGFEDVARCRNCGHDFTVAAPAAHELPLRGPAPPTGEFPDLSLTRSTPGDLPLFGQAEVEFGLRDVLPRVPPTRAPLSVRRATPEIARVRPETPRTPMLDLAASGSDDTPSAAVPTRTSPAPAIHRPLRHPILLDETEPAALSRRAGAAAIDLLVLALIDAIVIYFTLQICGLTIGDFWRLPKAPLGAFLLLQNGAYFAAFAAGGQTLGKMSAGIRVVSVDGPALDFNRSLKRTALWVLLAVPAGLGFLTTLLDAERRGLHDRLTGTRVVRTGAA